MYMYMYIITCTCILLICVSHTNCCRTDQLIHEVDICLLCLEANDAEHHNGGEDGGEGVSETHYDRVSECIVVRLGIAGESNEGTGRDSQ